MVNLILAALASLGISLGGQMETSHFPLQEELAAVVASRADLPEELAAWVATALNAGLERAAEARARVGVGTAASAHGRGRGASETTGHEQRETRPGAATSRGETAGLGDGPQVLHLDGDHPSLHGLCVARAAHIWARDENGADVQASLEEIEDKIEARDEDDATALAVCDDVSGPPFGPGLGLGISGGIRGRGTTETNP